MNNVKKITRKEYMENSKELHHEYYLQFATESTKSFILNSLKVEDIKKSLDSGDEHLNDIKIPYNNMGRGGGWWWDDTPINMSLLKELGEGNSPSTHTCVGKAVARDLATPMHSQSKSLIMKKFYYRDKSGRGYKGQRSAEDLKRWDNEEDYDGVLLHDFIENAEEGDRWEDSSDEITCIKS